MKTFYLIDGHAQIFRAYYAPFGLLNSPTGEPTKAIFIFTQMILSILRDKNPDYLAVTLDYGDEHTIRKEFFPEYKANRDEAPEDLNSQVERIVEILKKLRIPIYSLRGYEADDLIATAAHLLCDEDVELRVVSKDKDLHQILSDKVKLWDPQKDTLLDARALEEEKGYTPFEAIEIQTLTGDSTDNVPGIPGIGPKKALNLVKKYGTAESVYEHAHELTPKMRQNVLDSKDLLPLTRKLITLDKHVDFPFRLEDCAVEEVPYRSAVPIFEELGFRRLIETLSEDGETAVENHEGPEPGRDPSGEYHLVDTEEKFHAFLSLLLETKSFAVDTETTSLRPVDCDLVGLSFAWKSGEGWYLPLRSNLGSTLDPRVTLESLRPILEDENVEKCGQNIKYDIVVLRRAGIDLKGVAFDSMVASYLLHPERRNHGMDSLARDLLSYRTIPISDLIGKGKKQVSMLDVETSALCDYAGEDADITWRLRQNLSEKLTDPAVRSLFLEVEMPLVEVLADMEYNGVTLDRERLKTFSRTLGTRIEELVGEIHRAAEHEFTIDSPKQLAEVLFDELGLRVVKKTKTSRSTDASVLQTLMIETEHPLPRLVLEYRELTKLRSTYVDPLPDLVSPNTGRLHASFNQAVAATGRLSSSDPNLQNIPVRTELGREIRKAFIPGDDDHVLLTADYSQIELRILAHLSRDEALLEAFRSEQDIHTFVALQVNGVPIDQVTAEQRTRAKAVNFGIIYGQGAFGLARLLGISRNEASEFIRTYKERYSGIDSFMDRCIDTALKEGGVTTMLGRRRQIPEIHSRNRNLRAQGERLAINTVVQGSAADMIKVAMVKLHARNSAEGHDLRLLIQIHDELVFEVPRKSAPELAEVVRTEMAAALPLDVPVRVDVSWGDNWLEGKG